MSFHFHKDRQLYFEHQCQNALSYVIPFIEDYKPITETTRVLEIGCGEGGVMKAFIERGAHAVGVELDEIKYERAIRFLEDGLNRGQVRIIKKNIYDADFQDDPSMRFDVIVLKDVIEHIYDQPKLMNLMHIYLKPGGVIFFGFPPWQMPFGGHQQVCQKKWLSRLPWFHLLPRSLYHAVLRGGGEMERTVHVLDEIRDTRITLEQFERYTRQTQYRIVRRTLYLINPIYRYKFGLRPRKQFALLGQLPYLRNYLTTCGYYLLSSDRTR